MHHNECGENCIYSRPTHLSPVNGGFDDMVDKCLGSDNKKKKRKRNETAWFEVEDGRVKVKLCDWAWVLGWPKARHIHRKTNKLDCAHLLSLSLSLCGCTKCAMPSHLSKASKFLSSAFTLRLAPNPAKFRCSVKLSTMSNGEGAVRFPLSASSTLVIQKGDITKWFIDGSTDAIVSPSLFLWTL